MPGGSNATKEEPVKVGSPPSLLGAAGSAMGGTGKDDQIVDPVVGSPAASPANATIAEGARQQEKYSVLVRIFTTRDRQSLEPHAWVEDLLNDFFQSILGINLSVILLSPTECLIFCGNRTQGQGMSWDESLHYAHQLMGVHPWTSYMIEVVALQQTLKEVHHKMQVAREFTHERTKQRIAHLNAIAAALAVKAQPVMPQRLPRGRGMTRWADQFFVQQQLKELNLDEPTFIHRPTLLGAQLETPEHEQFDSTREDAEEDEGDTTCILGAELNISTGEEMDATGGPACMPSAERCQWRNCALRRQHNRARWEFRKPKSRQLSFPLFRETTKEDAISYRDWCSEIEDTLEHCHNPAKVKEVMFASLQGMAKDNAKMIDENGDLHVTRILDRLDSLYGVSMTFQSLNAALCGLQQKPMESAHTYYNRMVQITVILRECHGNRYRPGELARMSKDCFYAGLLPENCPMVVHLKDQLHTTPLDLLRALLEQEENDALTRTHYPPSTSARLSHPPKPAEHYHWQPPAKKRNDRYTVRPTQLDAAQVEAAPETDPAMLDNTMDALESWYNDGFLIGLHQATEISEFWSGRCFNCQKEGHCWHQCKELLSLELHELSDKQDKEQEERKKKALNPGGGMGVKGGHAPYTASRESTRRCLRHPAPPPSRQCVYCWLSLQILEWGHPLQMAGPGKSGLGHCGWCPDPGVGW